MAAITKVSLSFKETRQKTRQKKAPKNACKTRRHRAAEPAWRSLKKQVFSICFTFLNANCWSSFGGCFLNFSVFCVVFCLRKSLFLREKEQFIFQFSCRVFFQQKASPSKSQNQCFLVKLRALFFSRDIFKGAAALEFLLFLFLKIYFACLKNW